ncbi:hypothetical protein FTO70_08020 [Methanosarcina sp. KYL-1]|uniref:hypothetical protein n=1 Tax=Methanosarcina sp. KYL-1 TaxID=2602068 RepID=UPI00210158FB|nr:hypothetical protein [Methanosarcina sp. KYL-1]MCQ1535623.1 hypothetical protein [Methanosarcina sp. KYL-1]
MSASVTYPTLLFAAYSLIPVSRCLTKSSPSYKTPHPHRLRKQPAFPEKSGKSEKNLQESGFDPTIPVGTLKRKE